MRNLKDMECERCERVVEADALAIKVKCWACTQAECQGVVDEGKKGKKGKKK